MKNSSGKKKPAPKLQSIEEFFDIADDIFGDDDKENEPEKKTAQIKYDRNGKPVYDLTTIKPIKSKIANLSEFEIFKRLSFECQKQHVPEDLVTRLMVQILTYVRSNRGFALLLVGEPGIGKTYLASVISDTLGIPLHKISACACATGKGLVGDSKTYNNSGPGELINGIIRTNVKNPMFLIDEIDKTNDRSNSGNVHCITSELLACLDGSREIYDNYMQEFISTAEMIFILTANTVETIPLWLLDRCQIIRLENPGRDRLLAIVDDYVVQKSSSELYRDRIIMDKTTILQLTDALFTEHQTSIRQYLSAVDTLFDSAYYRLLSEKLDQVKISEKDIDGIIATKRINRRVFGFGL